MLSHRRDSTTGTQEDGRAKSAERKPMWIVLDVEKTEFQPFTDNLRAHGIIRDANFDIGSHHTHIISPGDEVELEFPGGFLKSDLSLLRETISSFSTTINADIEFKPKEKVSLRRDKSDLRKPPGNSNSTSSPGEII
jgi:stalled ribosome rescue protein Dom34